jgi:anti-sigma B factor antagonist
MIRGQERDLASLGRLTRFDRSARSARCGPLLAVRGELDLGSCRQFSAELLQLERTGAASLTVDLREVGWIDAGALGALLGAARRCRARGGRLRVVCAPGPVERLLRLTSPSIPSEYAPAVPPDGERDAAPARSLAQVAP